MDNKIWQFAFVQDPNQLIRASALRVLSSIRVPMIAPVMMLAIRESVRDMSAYVRKVRNFHIVPSRSVSMLLNLSTLILFGPFQYPSSSGSRSCNSEIVFTR